MESRQPSPPQSYPYGLPGYNGGGIPALLAPGPAISELFSVPPFQPPLPASDAPTPSAVASPSMTVGVPITQIPFPYLPSPIPTMSSIMGSTHPPPPHPPYVPEPANPIVPRYQKLEFPTYDGKDDPLGWLNKCEQFFRAQQTRHADWVWLASFHLNGVAQ